MTYRAYTWRGFDLVVGEFKSVSTDETRLHVTDTMGTWHYDAYVPRHAYFRRAQEMVAVAMDAWVTSLEENTRP